MARTNYLTISVVVTLLVTMTGSYGRLAFAEASALGVLLWLVEVVMSSWWLSYHRLGPVEWLWRSMTYGRLQRMRIAPPPPESI